MAPSKFRRSTAASLIKHFRDCVKNVPRELYANLILTAGPAGDALVVIELCYLGTRENGIEILQAIASWDGEQCLLNDVCEKSFLDQQSSFAHLLKGQRESRYSGKSRLIIPHVAGRKWFMRSDLLATLSDEVIHDTVVRFADTPTGCSMPVLFTLTTGGLIYMCIAWVFELAGGCVSDLHTGCLPSSLRAAAWAITAFHQWDIDDEDPLCVTSAEEVSAFPDIQTYICSYDNKWMRETLGPVSLGGPLPSVCLCTHCKKTKVIDVFEIPVLWHPRFG